MAGTVQSRSRVPRVSEKHFQTAVIELAEICGWKVAHFHDSRRAVGNGRLVGDRQAAGFPDLVLARGGRLIFAELKAEGGRISPAQAEWLRELQNVEVDTTGRVTVWIWKPTDMASGEIERLLAWRQG